MTAPTAGYDGKPQRVEYSFYTHQNGNLWTVNITVNDTVNGDHQWGRVLLEGTDAAGFSVLATTAEEGHAWESRTPTKGELVSFEPTTNLLGQYDELEPSQTATARRRHRRQRPERFDRAPPWATMTDWASSTTVDGTCASWMNDCCCCRAGVKSRRKPASSSGVHGHRSMEPHHERSGRRRN